MTDQEFQKKCQIKRMRRMNTIDMMTKEHRDLVNEYGFSLVWNFIQCRVTDPRHIRHLIECVLNEFSPTRGAFSSQGTRAAKGWQSEVQ